MKRPRLPRPHPVGLQSGSRSRLRTVVQTLLMLTLAACAPPDKASPLLSIRLQWLHQAQFAGFYAAREKGFFENAGLQVEIKPGGPDFNSIAMVISGSDFVGVTSADQILLARARGVPIKALFVVYRESQVCFMSKASSGIRTPQDFRGKLVGMKYGYNTETEYVAMLKRANLDRRAVRETPVKFDLQRFFSGEVDVWSGYIINEPLLAEENGYPVNVIRPRDFGVRGYSDTVFVSETTLANHPEKLKSLCGALRSGWLWALAHKEEAIDLVRKYNVSADRDHERRMLEISEPLIRGENQDGEPLANSAGERQVWADMIIELQAQNQLEKPISVDDAVTDLCGLRP